LSFRGAPAFIPAQASKQQVARMSEAKSGAGLAANRGFALRRDRAEKGGDDYGGDDCECPLLSDCESGPISCHSRGRLHLVLARRQIVERPLAIPIGENSDLALRTMNREGNAGLRF
jgi:hypothetical protein